MRSEAASTDVISFDIFDTLLIRRNHNPDDLKRATARFLARHAQAIDKRWTPEKVQRARDKVEAMHRRRNGRTHPDYEACYPKFMADTLSLIFKGHPDAPTLDETLAYELDIESAFLVARSDLLDLVRELKAQGKTIVAISDMYLPATALSRLLERAGYTDCIDAVFSSADTLQAKASGAAWPRVQEALNLEPTRWVHVGDHPISDGTRPAEFGLRAVVLRDADNAHRKWLAQEYARCAEARTYWRGRLAQQWMLPLEKENVPQSDLYQWGYHYLGPMLCAYMHGLAEQARARGLRRLYFLSREGECLQKIWRTITPMLYAGDASLPEDDYLYVSRMALAGPSCAQSGLNYENARVVFLPPTNRDFRDVARVFGLDLDPLKPYLRRHGLQTDSVLSRWHTGWHRDNDARFKRMLETDDAFQAEVRRQKQPAGQALERYLSDKGFFAESDVGLVDIGWLGTIQRYLHQGIAHRSDAPVLHGFVLANTGGYPFPYSASNRLDGFFYDHRRFDFAGSLILYAKEIFEEATRAAHPGLMSYQLKGESGYELEYRANDDEQAANEALQTSYFEPLQQGVYDAAARYGAVMAVTGYSPHDWKPWLNAQTVNRLAFPRTREVAALTRIHHLDDFGLRQRAVPPRARRAVKRLWTTPLWALRFAPWIRPWYYLKHAVHWLKTA